MSGAGSAWCLEWKDRLWGGGKLESKTFEKLGKKKDHKMSFMGKNQQNLHRGMLYLKRKI